MLIGSGLIWASGSMFWWPQRPVVLEGQYDQFQLVILVSIYQYGNSSSSISAILLGSTWMSQIMSLMLAGEENYERAKQTPIHDRVLFMEYTLPGDDFAQIARLDDVPTPRTVKTHMPFRFVQRWLTQDKVKTIVMTRNPKDTLVSHFHFLQNLKSNFYWIFMTNRSLHC